MSHRLLVELVPNVSSDTCRVLRRTNESDNYRTCLVHDQLIEHESTTWERIDTTLQRGSGHAYGQAFRLLQDLAEAYACVRNEAAFRRGLVRLMAKHGNRGAWVKRLMNAGFMWTPKT